MSKSKKTWLLGVLMVGVLLSTSCASEVVKVEEEDTIPESSPITTEETPANSLPSGEATAILTYETEMVEVETLEEIAYPKDSGDVIIPPSVHLRDCKPGMEGRWESKVYNSSLEPATYTTTFRYPDINNLNASAPPSDIGDWITIENPTINMEPKSEGVFNYRIEIPEDAELPEISEFWIVIKKADQKSFVQWEVILRCYLYKGE